LVLTRYVVPNKNSATPPRLRIVNIEITSLLQRQRQERHFHEQDRYILPPVAGSHTGWRLTAE
jgi:hypothetical protein